jgi:GDPmannose 4,6-dehydratase
MLTMAFARLLLGNPAKAEKQLGWKRQCSFGELVREMVTEDLEASKSLVENRN